MPLYAFDGTWNARKADDPATPQLETDSNTNVVRFLEAYDHPEPFYVKGIGTRAGFLGRCFGGMFGAGGRARLDEAVAHLRARRPGGDHDVDVVGFSRGAALALAFAHRVASGAADASGTGPQVRFLGLFDVVGAFGIPFNMGPLRFQEYNLGYRLTRPASARHCFHAMALDERRQTFRVTRVKGAYEVWFRGSHSDIGGGNGNLGLNNVALHWMLQMATACGLPIRPDQIAAAAEGRRPDAAVRWPDTDFIKNSFRRARPGDRVYDTVAHAPLVPGYNTLPPVFVLERPEATTAS